MVVSTVGEETGGRMGMLTLSTLCSLGLGSGPQGERVLAETGHQGPYKPPLLPDIWGCLAGLRLNACWVVQHAGTLHTSGSEVISLSISFIRAAWCLWSKTATTTWSVQMPHHETTEGNNSCVILSLKWPFQIGSVLTLSQRARTRKDRIIVFPLTTK